MVTLPPNRALPSVPESCRPLVLWLTGLPASGKSTLSSMLSANLSALGFHCIVLDGDRLRSGLCRDLGFTAADRSENIRRVGEVARLLVDAGLIAITALISPYQADRDRARSLFTSDQFYEIYLQCHLDVCQQRDPKGLYRKAQDRSIPFFTGLTDPYEPPTAPDLTLKTAELSVEESLRILQAFTLERCGSRS